MVGLDEAGECFALPCFRVPVVDTTGAGDVFHGAYIAAMLRGMGIRACCRFASAASAIKCTRLGGRAGIPDRGVAARFMETGEIDFADIDRRVALYRTNFMGGE